MRSSTLGDIHYALFLCLPLHKRRWMVSLSIHSVFLFASLLYLDSQEVARIYEGQIVENPVPQTCGEV